MRLGYEGSYQKTVLNPLDVARKSGFIAWEEQPAVAKRYPRFLYRHTLDASKYPDNLILHARSVTSRQNIKEDLDLRFVSPSAGNLHPSELYVQIRGIKGYISGIYHVDAVSGTLVLLQEIDHEGVEPFVGVSRKFDGLIFLLSLVPFRSYWKYGERAWRYILLDAGHQMGALDLAAANFEQSVTFLSLSDKKALNHILGFYESETVFSALACGAASEKAVSHLTRQLIKVTPTDYHIDTPLHQAFTNRLLDDHIVVAQPWYERTSYGTETIMKRRSARSFSGASLDNAAFERIVQIAFSSMGSLRATVVAIRCDEIDPGIYKSRGGAVKKGHYSLEVVKALLSQRFLSDAAIVLFIHSPVINSGHIAQAGIAAHKLSLEAASIGLGSSGIGAFYDKAVQDLIETDDYIIYALAIGSVA